MGDRFYLASHWILVILATVVMISGNADDALWYLGWAILFRMFWQESRD